MSGLVIFIVSLTLIAAALLAVAGGVASVLLRRDRSGGYQPTGADRPKSPPPPGPSVGHNTGSTR